MNDAPGHIGQTIVSACMAVCQLLVIKAHQMQDCGMEIVNMDDVFGDVDAVLLDRHGRRRANDLHACGPAVGGALQVGRDP